MIFWGKLVWSAFSSGLDWEALDARNGGGSSLGTEVGFSAVAVRESDDDIDDFTFGTISFDSAQSNYNYVPDEDDLLLNHPRVL